MPTNINFDKKLGITKGTNIILPSGPTWTDSTSFLYDGIDDYMESTVTFDTLDGLTDFTISFWIKPTTLTGHNTILRLDNGSGYLLFFIRHGTGQLDASFNVGSSFTRSTSNLVAGTWTHIALQFNGNSIEPNRYLQLKIYMNGVNASASNFSGAVTLPSATGLLLLGTNGITPTGDYNLNELAFFDNGSVNPVDLYNSGGAGDLSQLATPPVNWFRSENATWIASTYWEMVDEMGSGKKIRSRNTWAASSRVNDVPPNPFDLFSTTFDGVDDYVDCGDLSAYDTGDFSCSLWVYKTTSNDIERIISNSGSSSKAGFDIVMDKYENINVLRNTLTADTTSGYTAIGFTINTWHHVVATYKDSTKTLKIYLDGVLKDTTIGTTSSNSASISLSIGCYGSGVSAFFTGNIDEVGIFDVELSASDVTTIYNSGVPNDISALSPLGWWRMGDGDTYPTITDNGSGGNDGTMTNMSSANFVTDTP